MIAFENISKTYPKEIGGRSQTVLTGLSFSLEKGQTLGLVGPNGAGKSTTIKLLMDFIRPDQGTIRLFGAPPNTPQLRKHIGYLPEVANFPANLNVIDLLRFTSLACGIPKKRYLEKAEELLSHLDLWEVRRRPLRTYSKGMQQRANFAIALINDPDLLILDEPMSGLDPIGRKKIIDLIWALKSAGKTILFCSHILEDVDKLVDAVLLLHKGKKLFFGSPGQLASQEEKASIVEAFVSRIKKEELVTAAA